MGATSNHQRHHECRLDYVSTVLHFFHILFKVSSSIIMWCNHLTDSYYFFLLLFPYESTPRTILSYLLSRFKSQVVLNFLVHKYLYTSKHTLSHCSLSLSRTGRQYFSLGTNQPPTIIRQYFSLGTITNHPPNEQDVYLLHSVDTQNCQKPGQDSKAGRSD
jgi:hypothetical protein